MSASISRQSLRRYAIYFLAWTVNGVFSFSKDVTRRLYAHETFDWRELFNSWMVGTYLCAAFTPLILWLGDRWPIERHNWPKRAAMHLLFAAGFSVVELALEAVVFIQLGIPASLARMSFWNAFSVLLVIGFHGNVITYLIVLGIQSGARYYRRYKERELRASELQSQLARAQLSALKMQLQPHFLFNTLNAIMVLVRQHKGPEAEEMLSRLGDLLRCVLEDVETQEVPLERELEYLRLYLAIEQVRFQDRLTIEIEADPEVLDAAVPHMGLQPIVENALRHGIARNEDPGTIAIRAVRAAGWLELQVTDDGPGLARTDRADSPGIGLANTRARLQQLYGDEAKLTVENGRHGGVVVIMSLPYRPATGIAETKAYASDSSNRG